MCVKVFERIVSIVLVIMMLVVCIPTAFAVTSSNNDYSDTYEPGAVLVSLKSGSASVISELLKNFEIESIRLITPGSSTMAVYYVKFVEKTKEIVREAIAILNDSSYVNIAEPNYIGQYLPVNEPTVVDSTEATEFADPLIEIVRGDTDDDGSLSIVDATLIQRYLVNLYDFNDKQILAADTDGDGSVSILDTTMIQRKLVGLAIEG